MQQVITDAALAKISENDDLKLAIAKVTDRAFRTVEKWVRENDSMLTLVSVLNLIKQHTGLTDSEILMEAKETAKT